VCAELGFLLSVAAAGVCSGWIVELPDQKLKVSCSNHFLVVIF
jgi:hypothetical protein